MSQLFMVPGDYIRLSLALDDNDHDVVSTVGKDQVEANFVDWGTEEHVLAIQSQMAEQ